MTLDLLSVLQTNSTIPPADAAQEAGIIADEHGPNEAFAQVFAQAFQPLSPDLDGQNLAAAPEDGALGSSDSELTEAGLGTTLPPWMVAPTVSSSIPSATTVQVGSLPLAGTAETTGQSQTLADLESGNLANRAILSEGQPLKSTWLAPGRFQLITPTEPSADTDEGSLLAFARGQGLDAAALEQLFGREIKSVTEGAVKAAWVPAAAWIAGGQKSMGVQALVRDSEPVTDAWPDRLAAEKMVLSLSPGKRLLEPGLSKRSDPPDWGGTTGDEGRVDLDLDVAGLLGELAPEADLKALRAEERAALSLRIGEMLAQRMVAQAQRGQWQLRFALNPQHLGRVEIDMQMRAGELEATLGALNPATRELLQEALPRLREMLQQSGMDVASLNIGSGGASKNGGQPTPQAMASGPKGGPSLGAESQPDVSKPKGRIRGADGWDIWV